MDIILGFSTKFMDTNADPHADFFRYSAGKWMSSNPVPPDKSHWGTFMELFERNTALLGDILKRCSEGPEDETSGKLGDLYKSFMDENTLEKLGFKPVKDEMSKLDSITSREELDNAVVSLHLSGTFPFFVAFAKADKKNSTTYALYMFQGGLSLPDRDYYLADSFSDLRKDYISHVSRIFSMYGLPKETSEKYAQTVFTLEHEMAEAARSRVELRDAEKNYNSFPLKDLDTEFTGLNLQKYVAGLRIPPVENVVVGQPEYLKALGKIIASHDLEDLKVYMKWKLLNSAASLLSPEVEAEHFDMFVRKIRGQKEQEPRWKRAVNLTDQCLGDALGELYVREHFGKEARERMQSMVDDIREIFKERLMALPWMTEETKKHAMVKFERFRAKIGHPVKFKDYSSVEIRKDDLVGNVSRAVAFEIRRQLDRVGGPVDRDEWFMTPATINAYFSPPDNEIVFPAGILQPPFFDVEADDAVNYGAIGAVISHEITHGYDDQGRRYDENGNLRDWWSQEDRDNFLERAKAVIELYNSLEILPGLKVNGELTLGENIADFGGISIAYDALQRHLSRNPDKRVTIDGLTPEQRFYISWAQIWKDNIMDQEATMRAKTDPHAPNKFRAVVPVYNHIGFDRAFPPNGATAADPSLRRNISIW